MLSTKVIDTVDGLAAIDADWDRLAVAGGRPFAAPAWALAWWKHLRPADAQLRVVVVDDGDRIVGIGPFYVSGRAWRLLAASYSAAVAPLSEAGREAEVARAIGAAIAATEPRPATLKLEQQSADPDWGSLLADALADGGRPLWRTAESSAPAPRIDLGEDGFDGWLAAKSSSFRRETRRKQRRMEELGAQFRYASPETVERDLGEFLRLHRTRREGMGGSSLAADDIEHALVEAARGLLPEGRMGVLCLDVDGSTVAAQLFATAGAETSAWNSGFDESYSKLSPSMQCILRGLADLSERGGRTMSLGPGGQDYKYRLAGDSDEIATHVLVVPGRGSARTRTRLQARALAKAGKRRLSAALSRD
jgi:CelD/BcsL family acetyltransferase involved in cellulose biosynthesis